MAAVSFPTSTRYQLLISGGSRQPNVELSGLRLITNETAEISLAVSWHRIDESTMRTSFLSQKWTSTTNGWELAAELRSGGAPGLFKAPPRDLKKKRREGAPNVQTGQL